MTALFLVRGSGERKERDRKGKKGSREEGLVTTIYAFGYHSQLMSWLRSIDLL